MKTYHWVLYNPTTTNIRVSVLNGIETGAKLVEITCIYDVVFPDTEWCRLLKEYLLVEMSIFPEYKDIIVELNPGSTSSKVIVSLYKDTQVNFAPKQNLSIKDIYEQNKGSSICIGCGNKTSPKALFSSVVNYCRSCCG